ncbi:MAG: SpoIIE family protein phosphatase [Bryobacteraceae bacterium]
MAVWLTNRVLYWVIAVLFFLAASWQAAIAVYVVRQMQRAEVDPIRPFYLATATDRLAAISDDAQKAGLRVGDQVISLGSEPYRGESQVSHLLLSMHPSQTLSVRVHHPGQSGDAVVPIPLEHGQRAGALGWALNIAMFIVTPAFCLILGFGVLAARPRDGLAWLLLMMMLSFAQMSTGEIASHAIWSWPSDARIIALAYHSLFDATWGAWILLFGIYFPERVFWDRRFPWLKWVVIVPIAAAAAGVATLAVGDSENIASVTRMRPFFEGVYVAGFYAGMIAISGFFISIGMKYGMASSSDAKRRLKLLEWGAGVALTPLFFVAVYGIKYGFTGIPDYFFIPAILFLAVFPLTLAYVIVVQRALDVRVVVRQGLRYALAARGVRVLQAMVASAVIWGAFTIAANLPAWLKVAIVAVSVVFVLRIRQAGAWLSRWVDRRFFREAYSAEQILSELGEKVRSIVETGPLLRTVAQQISQSLHVNRVAMLVKSDGHYEPAYSIGYSVTPAIGFQEHDGTIQQLKQNRQPLKIYPDDPESWIYRDETITDQDRDKLRELDSQLLLPLAVQKKLIGVVSLGPKRSEEPYSKSDVHLLESVAAQTGLALENSFLTQAIAGEVAQRERLSRELEIAREVQERLFPQTRPEVPGLDYDGRCRPALGVGGDYYDFIELPGGGFGVAIGDVSGKGIPAALLMACLQASLRGQTISGTVDLAGLMSNMNQLIFNATPSNRYATFFYARYEPDVRKLTYVNAGHNPPMIFRGAKVIRLEEGGPIVGLFRPAQYIQAAVQMERGDVLVLFTDGISESMNANDDEWGEEALIEVVQRCGGMRASDVINRLIGEADAFAAGAPQHDDMTVVVLRAV